MTLKPLVCSFLPILITIDRNRDQNLINISTVSHCRANVHITLLSHGLASFWGDAVREKSVACCVVIDWNCFVFTWCQFHWTTMAIPPTPIYQRNITTFDNLAHPIELGRRLIIVRHGERVDRCFARQIPNWIHDMFPENKTGTYRRVNLNMPRRCVLRGTKEDEFNLLDYKNDSPLTAVGEGTAERLGSRILGSNLKITKVYCSPTLRCMLTCHRLLNGYVEAGGGGKEAFANGRRQFPMNIEPLLYDFTGFVENELFIPTMLTPDFMMDRKILINKEYKTAATMDDLVASEEIEAFYKRIEKVIDKILKDTEKDTHGSILIVTHGPVMDAICQTLLRQPARSVGMFPKVANYPPYLATMVMEENIAPKSWLKWRLAPPPIKSFTFIASTLFDWKKLTERR